MDYDKLIEQLRRRGLSNGSALGPHSGLYEEAVLAIETLRADLARVTAERDGAVEEVKRLKAVMRDEGIVVIPPKYLWKRAEWNVRRTEHEV